MQQAPDAKHQIDLPLRLACVHAARRLDHDEVGTNLGGRQLRLTEEADEIEHELGM